MKSQHLGRHRTTKRTDKVIFIVGDFAQNNFIKLSVFVCVQCVRQHHHRRLQEEEEEDGAR